MCKFFMFYNCFCARRLPKSGLSDALILMHSSARLLYFLRTSLLYSTPAVKSNLRAQLFWYKHVLAYLDHLYDDDLYPPRELVE